MRLELGDPFGQAAVAATSPRGTLGNMYRERAETFLRLLAEAELRRATAQPGDRAVVAGGLSRVMRVAGALTAVQSVRRGGHRPGPGRLRAGPGHAADSLARRLRPEPAVVDGVVSAAARHVGRARRRRSRRAGDPGSRRGGQRRGNPLVVRADGVRRAADLRRAARPAAARSTPTGRGRPCPARPAGLRSGDGAA